MTDIQQTRNGMGDLRVRVRGLQKSFADNHVIRGIDLDVAAGTTTVMGLFGNDCACAAAGRMPSIPSVPRRSSTTARLIRSSGSPP